MNRDQWTTYWKTRIIQWSWWCDQLWMESSDLPDLQVMEILLGLYIQRTRVGDRLGLSDGRGGPALYVVHYIHIQPHEIVIIIIVTHLHLKARTH